MPDSGFHPLYGVYKFGKNTKHLVIYAHGANNNRNALFSSGQQKEFKLNHGTVRFYIKANTLYNVISNIDNRPYTAFEVLMGKTRRVAQPEDEFHHDGRQPVPDYSLSNATGLNLTNAAGQSNVITDKDLLRLAQESNTNGYTPFDILSVRWNPIARALTTLERVVNWGAAEGYDTFHCVFCRAGSGINELKATNLR
jgi:hypothetical protein